MRREVDKFETVLDDVRAKWALALEPKTRAGYKSILDRWLIGDSDLLHPKRACRFRRVKLADVSTKMVQEFVNEAWAVRSPNTVRRIYGVIKAVMDEATIGGYIATNPVCRFGCPARRAAVSGARTCT